ncbi:kinase-like domain-containing protein [Ephemerocybe angulata]|uniref:Kinase-like domain-containing protein n=1 Tax=Ephemerocybe angulata TaxID=980116 RepID=A0A8H6M329_9AGAR|nr:kinase-like domain-containing protein [Tulosesus angulatus]
MTLSEAALRVGLTDADLDPKNLNPGELWWKDQYDWLQQAGYRLRSRFSPDWEPSWSSSSSTQRWLHEDSLRTRSDVISHATQVEGGGYVVLKRVDRDKYPLEVEISSLLAEEPLRSDPNNHCIPSIEIMAHPTDDNIVILVLPVLRDFDDPPFDTVGEVLDFIRQFFVGLAFLHENRIIHGDISINNVMMDASGMYPQGFHPINNLRSVDFEHWIPHKYTRTEKPPRYYIIDFGLSKHIEEGESPLPMRAGTDITAPEYLDKSKTVNAFYIDVYCVGNMIRQEFLDGDAEGIRLGYHSFEFLRPLLTAMTDPEPEKRPTMPVALAKFDEIVGGLSSLTLRSQSRPKENEDFVTNFERSIRHWYKRLTYVIKRRPPIPTAGT